MTATAQPTRVRVLWVDDNRDSADSAALLLTLLGCDGRACYGGPAAVAEASAFEPHACFVDLNMPGMDGDETAERLRSAAGGRPMLLVCVTARTDPAAAARIRSAGFHLHLVKPIDPDSLTAVLRGTTAGVRAAERAGVAAAG